MKRGTILLALLVACASPTPDASSRAGREAYTQTNLHPDEARAKLTTVNYQQGGLIPVCSKVSFVSESRKSVTFRVEQTGREYTYLLHGKLVEPFDTHLDRYFGAACDPAKIGRMSAIDQQGIREGRVHPGMTKEGVVLAIGYPPDHKTPSLDADSWTYWRNRFATFAVEFQNGVVANIRE
jgi:hypothetical protein